MHLGRTPQGSLTGADGDTDAIGSGYPPSSGDDCEELVSSRAMASKRTVGFTPGDMHATADVGIEPGDTAHCDAAAAKTVAVQEPSRKVDDLHVCSVTGGSDGSRR